MENRVQQPTPVPAREVRIVRMGAEPVQRRCLLVGRYLHLQPTTTGRDGAGNAKPIRRGSQPSRAGAKSETAAEAIVRRTAAKQKAKGRARLCRADEYEVLRCAYRAVRAWRSDGVQRDETNDLALRFEAAKAAAPYVHPKLVAIQHLDERSGALGDPSELSDNDLAQEMARIHQQLQ